jgi:hypothetical protein
MKYTDRYEILRESRKFMVGLRNDYEKDQQYLCDLVSDWMKEKLIKAGIVEDKIVSAVVDTYTKDLKVKEYPWKADKLISTTKFNYTKNPILHVNAIELKIKLKEISAEFNITGDIDVDNGRSFTYQIQVHFPVYFQKQVEKSKFDLYDTYPLTEEEMSQPRISKENQLESFKSYVNAETKKSRIGYINTDEIPKITGDIAKDTVLKTQSIRKLRYSYWLDQKTFIRPKIDTFYRKQSFLFNLQFDSLLKSNFNLLDVNDSSAVSKILDDASVLHTQRAQKRNPLRDEAGNFLITVEKEIEDNLNLAVSKEGKAKSLEFEIEPLIEPIPVHIVNGFYTLRYLKSRDYKSKLLNALNYYREIQRRLTCDMIEMGSRDRLNLGCNILSAKDGGNQSKKLLRKATMNDLLIEALEAESDIDHFVSIKGFKHKKLFKPKITASSPCLPKLHSAFEGDPDIYEVSEEQDIRSSGQLPSESAKSLRGRIWQRKFDDNNDDVQIIDEDGIVIMYDSSLHDIVSVEEELIKIGTFYIQKQEYLIDAEIKEPYSAIDRGALCADLLEYEWKFQYSKILFIEQFMEAYEHTCDIVEQQRLIQIIVDTMAKRPRLNVDATYFIDSYNSEIDYFTKMRELIREVMDSQIKKEKKLSNEIK